jgi:hypothetical protein
VMGPSGRPGELFKWKVRQVVLGFYSNGGSDRTSEGSNQIVGPIGRLPIGLSNLGCDLAITPCR